MNERNQTIHICIFGTPQQRGSKKAMPIGGKAGGRTILVDSCKKSKPWMATVSAVAAEAFDGELIREPVRMTARFYFARPNAHYGAKGVKAKFIGEFCPKTPDLDKLLRAVGDALSGVIYHDDKLVVCYGEGTGKYWTREQERCELTIETLKESP